MTITHTKELNGTIQVPLIGVRMEAEHQRTEDTLSVSQAELKMLSQQIIEAQEFERRNLAGVLHDDVGQLLSTLGVHLSILSSMLPPDTTELIRLHLRECQDLTAEVVERTRNVMAELHPPLLDEYGVLAALQHFGETFGRHTGVRVVVEGEEPKRRVPPAAEITLFRVAQEALANVVRHAETNQATVAVEELSDGLRLTITDDGAGFDPTLTFHPGDRASWGLAAMRERAKSLGSSLIVESVPGKGTKVSVDYTFPGGPHDMAQGSSNLDAHTAGR